MIGLSVYEITSVLLVLALVFWLLWVLFGISTYEPEENKNNAFVDEELEQQVVKAVLQAYLDGVEYGLSMSKVNENKHLETANNDEKERDGE